MNYIISVIVPVYNAEETISSCLDSLVNQDYDKDSFEIIVVDNGSTDSTAQIIKNYPVEYIFFDGVKTSYAARNKGIEASRGELLAFTDADCRADRKWLSKIAECFRDKQIGGAGGRILYEGLPHGAAAEYRHRIPLEASGKEMLPWINTANAIYRKDVLYEVGLFYDYFISSGDVDLGWRVCLRGYKLHYEPRAVMYHKLRKNWRGCYRQHFIVGYGKIQRDMRYAFIFNQTPVSSFKKLWQIWNDFSEELFCKFIQAICPLRGFNYMPGDFTRILAEYAGRIYGWFMVRSQKERLFEPISENSITQNKALLSSASLDEEKLIVQEDSAIWWYAGQNISFFNWRGARRFTLEGPGAELWQQLCSGKDFPEAANIIHRDYEVEFAQLKGDLLGTVEELTKQGLIRIETAEWSLHYLSKKHSLA